MFKKQMLSRDATSANKDMCTLTSINIDTLKVNVLMMVTYNNSKK
jgi:hypothetical protein